MNRKAFADFFGLMRDHKKLSAINFSALHSTFYFSKSIIKVKVHLESLIVFILTVVTKKTF